MAEPNAAESAAMTSLADMASWVPMASVAAAAFCEHLGFGMDEPWRALGFMDASWPIHLNDRSQVSVA
eukprot:4872599-Amphidinium_carterae.1